MADVKQVIVMRKDLKMRRGKEIAQGAHASIKWLVDRVKEGKNECQCCDPNPVDLSWAEQEWMEGLFKKVTL